MSAATRAEVCAVACAEAYRGNGEVIASAFGTHPAIGVRSRGTRSNPTWWCRTARQRRCAGRGRSAAPPTARSRRGCPSTRSSIWCGRQAPHHDDPDPARRVRQLQHLRDRGSRAANVQLLVSAARRETPSTTRPAIGCPSTAPGVRAQGRHGVRRRQRQRAQGGSGGHRYHELRRVVTDLAVLDFTPDTGRLRLVSVHPRGHRRRRRRGHGFDLVIPDSVPQTRDPERGGTGTDPHRDRSPQPARQGGSRVTTVESSRNALHTRSATCSA